MGDDFEGGVFLIDKPVGPSSFRIVQLIRKALQIKKVGHTGTLDPFASGLLIVCVGRPATRMISQLMAGDKLYEAVLQLGVETDTLDTEGQIISVQPVGSLTASDVENCLAKFRGALLQAPPAFSAAKYKGKPLYHYARKGVMIEKEPRPVFIRELRCLALEAEQMVIRVRCGKGTYIRTLASDIGKALGCGAHLTALRRLENGPFCVDGALPGAMLESKEQARDALLANYLSVEQASRLTNSEKLVVSS
nr:tRNA pseudouridine(55) synthase TruB [Desulfobulbaceae bacterium]